MAQRRTRLFQKQWALVTELQRSPHGLSRKRLMEETGLPSTTLHRCIAELRGYGVPIETQTRNGEAWYRLDGMQLPPLTVTASQLMALRVARRLLAPLSGTGLAAELDGLLAPHKARDAAPASVSLRKPAPSAPGIVSTLDRAITQRRRVKIRVYTRGRRNPHDRDLDPLALRFTEGAVYLVAFDRDKHAYRTFKVARISHAHKLPEQAGAHPGFDEEAFFGDALKVGAGAPIEVTIRFGAGVAKILREYPPLPQQSLADEPDGSVTLRARVAGLHEVQRWVLGWGKDAEVLAPPSLREAVAGELGAAAQRYDRKRPRPQERSELGPRPRVLPRIADRG